MKWPTPRSAYLHIPFCRHRCGYCNFSVVTGRESLVEPFLGAIDAELKPLGRPILQTLFLGGGTPTFLNTAQLCRLFEILQRRFQWDASIELTVECNPEDLSDDHLQCLVDHGVNRVSLGIQSFDDGKLIALDRSHSGRQAREAIELASNYFKNISMDLIFAAPNETLEVWQRDLETALQLPISHLSTYCLTYEKGTRFWSRRAHGELQPLGEALEVAMYQCARETAGQAGMKQYEVSNFASNDMQCRHNQAYWRGLGWYAAGPGAASFVEGQRCVNHRSTTTWLRRIEQGESPIVERDSLTRQQYARELAAFGVRMIDGVDLDWIQQASGIDLNPLCGDVLKRCRAEELLIDDSNRLKLTEKGVLFADTVASRLLG